MKEESLVPGGRIVISRAIGIVPYLTPDEVYQIADAAKERDKL
jgi:hypothetical protein